MAVAKAFIAFVYTKRTNAIATKAFQWLEDNRDGIEARLLGLVGSWEKLSRSFETAVGGPMAVKDE